MPESMSVERRKMLLLLGAKLELTPAAQGMRAPSPALRSCKKEIPNSIIPQQFDNPANPSIHRAPRLRDLERHRRQVDGVISGIGTGGHHHRVGSVLKARKPSVKMIAVEPEDSAILSGGRRPAQDSRHRRRLHSLDPRSLADRRNHHHRQ